MEGKEITIVFKDDGEEIQYINVTSVMKGTDDYFIKLGSIAPPTLPVEEAENIEKVEIQSLFTFAMTKSTMKRFIELLQNEYEKDEKER